MRGDVIIRHLPRTTWLRLFVSLSGKCEPGAGWMYAGIVYRRAWRVGRIGFGWMWMPSDARGRARARKRAES